MLSETDGATAATRVESRRRGNSIEMSNVFCTGCGRANVPDDGACLGCGKELVVPGAVPRATGVDKTTASLSSTELSALRHGETARGGPADRAMVVPADGALFVVKRGPDAGSRYLLDADFMTVGRHPNADLVLDDVTVSRRHAEFHRRDGEFTVRDVGSLNGTYVNRARIEEVVLAEGDEVRIGKFAFVFVAGRKRAPDPVVR